MPDEAIAAADVAKTPAPPPPPAAPAAPAATPVAAEPEQLSPDEERELGRLLGKQAAVAAAGDVVRLKVELPHVQMQFAGIVVGSDWTPVPAQMEPRFMNAAAEAGVEISRES